MSDSTVGAVVGKNLGRGKKYVYFCPGSIVNLETERQKLLANIGVSRMPRLASRVTIIPVDGQRHEKIFRAGSTIVFFSKDSEWETGRAFEEIVISRFPARGLFWQEHLPTEADRIHREMKRELEDWRKRSPSIGAIE